MKARQCGQGSTSGIQHAGEQNPRGGFSDCRSALDPEMRLGLKAGSERVEVDLRMGTKARRGACVGVTDGHEY